MLGLGVAAQGAGCVFMYGLPFLLPTLESDYGLSLAQAGVIVGAPSAGMLFTLIAWGWAADKYGERLTMTGGLALATAFLGLAAFSPHPAVLAVALALAGASGASANASSGRVVLGWFPREKRGVAMGWRQTAQPLGVALAGVIAPFALHLGGLRGALLAMTAICLVTTVCVGVFVVDPPRPAAVPGERTASPYRDPVLWRVHAASMLLVVPQFATAAFALTFLVSERHWDAGTASQVIAAAQLAGAGGRLLCGRWSDWAGSRVGPMRQLAVINGVAMLALAAGAQTGNALGSALLIAALVISMSGNGLAFTAVSELAGPAWAGRAMGGQNTAQNLVAAGTPPVLGALITGTGFGTAFALAGALALAASAATPGRSGLRRTELEAELG
ncbi:MFS transporter [Planotetraspora thailandica]|uniref:MFS transporter n=2 Tax=Planotetraspora thailandica TaxID=487172 RepID=A0A8J3V4Y2_9ACTN|nr:MFS transporter [Planotetraspora thailandica]